MAEDAQGPGEEQYVSPSPVQKVAQRLEEGVPLERLLRYMHAQSSVPRSIRDLVDLVSRLSEGVEVLMPLAADEGGLLRTPPGSVVEHASDLVVAVRSLNVAVSRFTPGVREKLIELTKEVEGGEESEGAP